MNRNDRISQMRVAVVHEWIDAYAGSEQVFEAIAQELPSADVFALSLTPGVELDVGGRPIQTTGLNRPVLRDRRALTLPVMPLAWRSLPAQRYDLVVSSSHAFAHANRLARPGGLHIAYVHSPARYLWSPEIDGRGFSPLLAPAKAWLKRVDVMASRRVAGYAANSSAVAGRIDRFWSRDSTVIHPPVRVEFFQNHRVTPTRDYILGVGRWVRYKHLDLIIRAGEAAGLPVKIAGRGPDEEALRDAAAAARVPVQVILSPTDAALRVLYANAACVMFPTVEDFGMVPVEAQAAGTPVVALGAGGALETVIHRRTGVLVDDLSVQELARGVHLATTLDPADCVANAGRFNRATFNAAFGAWVDSEVVRHFGE